MSGLSEMFKQFLGAFHEIPRSNSQDIENCQSDRVYVLMNKTANIHKSFMMPQVVLLDTTYAYR